MTIAILYSGTVPSQAAIAGQIADGLSNPVYSVRSIDTTAQIDAFAEPKVDIAIAVGPGALDVAKHRFGNAEIIFSQVLEPDSNAHTNLRIHGIAPMPPLTLQFAAWAELDDELKRIGLITSTTFADMVPGATNAATAIGAQLDHRISTSDRETLYIFRRLASTVDGLWLAPDGKILSTSVIDEILAYAAELNVGVLVFSESLLERGGLISVGATTDHIANTVIDAIEQIRSGQSGRLPHEIPLNEAQVRVNAKVAAELGLRAEAPTEWVIRDH